MSYDDLKLYLRVVSVITLALLASDSGRRLPKRRRSRRKHRKAICTGPVILAGDPRAHGKLRLAA